MDYLCHVQVQVQSPILILILVEIMIHHRDFGLVLQQDIWQDLVEVHPTGVAIGVVVTVVGVVVEVLGVADHQDFQRHQGVNYKNIFVSFPEHIVINSSNILILSINFSGS